ncbi:MAG: protein kinase [Blastocatellia bacterium]
MSTRLKSPPLPLHPPPAVVPGIYNTAQQALTLGSQIGVGGEGTVYEIQGQPDFVAKLYHEPPSAEKAAKLVAMTRFDAARLSRIAAWPVDALRDTPDGNVIGFVMHKIGQAEEVHALHSPKSRLRKFPDASWSFLLHVATNIARAVATLHEQGFVIGDVNPKNILVTKKATVYLLDCDSFQFVDGDKTYRCEGGFPEYTPPELQGIPFSEINRTQEHDCFGLAVVIFQLLFLGRHPYSGRFLGVGEMTLEQAIREGRFAYGTDAATRQMQPPPGTLPLEAIPDALTELLHNAFLRASRPPAHEWIAPLTNLATTLQRCMLHSGHYFYEGLTACPWCQIETRARIRLFNFNPGEARRHQSAFRLPDIWAEVGRLQAFEMPEQKVLPLPQLSREVVAFVNERRSRHWVAVVFAVFGGFFSGLIGGVCAMFWLMPLLWVAIKAIAGAKQVPHDQAMQTLFGAPPPAADGKLAQQVYARQKKADTERQEIEQKLGGTKEREAYFAKLSDLQAKLRAHENLTRLRQKKLAALEAQARSAATEIPAEARQRIEEEGERRQCQLEYEITSTTLHLRQLKQQMDVQRQQLLPTLQQARQTYARTEKELEILRQRNRMWPLTLMLLAAFLFGLISGGSFTDSYYDDSVGVVRESTAPQSQSSTVQVPAGSADNSQYFHDSYQAGKKALARQNYSEARMMFMTALQFVSEDNWQQEYSALFYDLSQTLIATGEAVEARRELESAVNANLYDNVRRCRLAMLYALTGRQQDARQQYQYLIPFNVRLAESLRKELEKHDIFLSQPQI